MTTEILKDTIWEMMIEQYGQENLKKVSMQDLLEMAWWFYNNPINEERIKEIMESYGLPFNPL